MTVSNIDYALMSGVADRKSRSKENQFPVPAGWVEMVDGYETRTSGFEATYFKNGNQIVIAFAGTNTSFFSQTGDTLRDVIADLELGLGNINEQLLQAAEYYMYVKSLPENVGAEITFTGHSLGGGLAALMGVLFNEKAVVFDPAPFVNALNDTVKNAILAHLQGQPYRYDKIEIIDPSGSIVDVITVPVYAPRLFETTYLSSDIETKEADFYNFTGNDAQQRIAGNISGKYMEGEFCRSFPIADEFLNAPDMVSNGVHNIGGSWIPAGWSLDLHSLSLLTAFMIDDNRLSKVTEKMPFLLDMLYDSNLYHYSKKSQDENFLERLIRYQTGHDAPGATASNTNMLTRFTDDLEMIAQEGGLTMNENIAKALSAFAMQMYYENPAAANPENYMVLFDEYGVTGGIHFDHRDGKGVKSPLGSWLK